MNEALLLVAEGYEQIAAGIRKMLAVQKNRPMEEPVKAETQSQKPEPEKKAEKEAPKAETKVDLKTVRVFLAEKSRAGKTTEVKNLITQFGYAKLSDVPEEKLPELYKKAQEVL